MLGASWLLGKAVRGKGRGNKLGFPTANLELADPDQRPPEGIYAARVRFLPLPEGESVAKSDRRGWEMAAQPSLKLWPAGVHVGPVPSFNQKKPTVEVHILDFPYQELYDQQLAVQFVERIADIKKFDSIEDLKKRIQENVDRARELLAH